MGLVSHRVGLGAMALGLALAASGGAAAQDQDVPPASVTVTGAQADALVAGPELRGIITARSETAIRVTADDGTQSVVAVDDATQIRTRKGFLGVNRADQGRSALLPGLPVTVKTVQSADGLVASRIDFRNTDFKTATMIHQGTAQRFDDQAAATEALRGRLGDIDKYNIKSTTNVYFDVGKWQLSPQSKAELCAAAQGADQIDNALMLVVGYADSTGSDDFNQVLSERRAGRVINHLQQACGWKPYRMLTPTGMAEADPLASNDTPEGRAQNRRVSVNVLVSKGLDGM